LLHKRLMAATPDCSWLSEEPVGTLKRLDKYRIWVVDPLDGTKELIEGLDEFAVSVAFVEDGRPLLSVLHNPATSETITGIMGRRLTHNGETTRTLSGRMPAARGC
jgi:myo-inositol-1(or 4)-monophosphatase